MERTILVIGGTGMLGQPVSRDLKDAGFHVRIVTRDRQKAKKLYDDSFEVIAGDPMDTNCLEKALAGCDGVHISLPSEVEQQVAEMVAQVASKHGVERITYISGATVAEENRWFPMINRKFLAEKALRASGIPHTIFCPTWVMEILPKFVNQGRASVLGKQPCPYHWIAAEDIAKLVSAAYSLGDATNQRFIVHGPEAIHMQVALRRYCGLFHPNIKEVSTMPFWLVKLLATITGNQELKGAGEMMAYFEKVGEGNHTAAVEHNLSATTTLEMWLKKRDTLRQELARDSISRPVRGVKSKQGPVEHLAVLFDPWPLETLYLARKQKLPPARVVCIDNLWLRDRERQRGAATAL